MIDKIVRKVDSQELEKLYEMWRQVHDSMILSKTLQLGREKYNLQCKQSRK